MTNRSDPEANDDYKESFARQYMAAERWTTACLIVGSLMNRERKARLRAEIEALEAAASDDEVQH